MINAISGSNSTTQREPPLDWYKLELQTLRDQLSEAQAEIERLKEALQTVYDDICAYWLGNRPKAD